MRPLYKCFIQIIESALIAVLYVLLRALPMSAASWTGGKIARIFGPFFKAHHTALRNLEDVFPAFTTCRRHAIVGDMWENLGRTAAEFPHMPHLTEGTRLEIIGKEHILAAFASDRPHLFVSCHMANWETMPKAVSLYGKKSPLVYRHANNPLSERIIQYIRASYQSRGISKTEGTRDLVAALRAGENIGMLIDQKMNTGIAVPFFGRDAMTTSMPATAMLRYGAGLIPIRSERLDGCKFRVTIYPPVKYTPTGDKKTDDFAVIKTIHSIFETWIRERPEQWMWAHNRWPKRT